MTRHVVAALTAASLLAALSCRGFRVRESESEDFTFELGNAPALIEARLDRGRIAVEVSPSGAVRVEVDKTARAVDREAARALLESVEVEIHETERGLRIECRSILASSDLLGGGVATELVLQVPQRSDLVLRTGDGSVEVEGIEGSLDLVSGDGRIELERVSGDIRVRSADGRIVVRELDGNLDARTEDGRLELEGRFQSLNATTGDGPIRLVALDEIPRSLERSWTLRSSDGSIRLALPPTLSADIEASTADGAVEIDLPRFIGTRNAERVRGTLGDGGATILVVTMDGAIRFEES